MVARHTEKRSIAFVHYNPEGFDRSSVSKLPKGFEDEAEGPNIITPTFNHGTWPETQTHKVARATKCTFARSKPSEAIIPRLSPVHHQRCCIVDRVTAESSCLARDRRWYFGGPTPPVVANLPPSSSPGSSRSATLACHPSCLTPQTMTPIGSFP